MSFITIDNVSLSGVLTVVPKQIKSNEDSDLFNSANDSEKFISVTGIKEKRHVEGNVCTSDLCCKAAELLLDKINWSKDEIDILIMVTQTPDYLAPNTSIIMQDRLGLPKTCICFDVPLGCSGYVYGLSIISQFLQNGSLEKGLLLVGDTLSRQCSPQDKSTFPLFGDAGTASAVEYKPNSKMNFNLWSDGSGYKAIIVPDGGYRNPFTLESLVTKEDKEGNIRSQIQTFMEGSDVFTFGISVVTKEFKKFIEHFNIDVTKVDYSYFHQANKFMNEMIRKKVGLTKEQLPYSLHKYGNTSSATIPLTMSYVGDVTVNKSVIFCGFGVGLSIGIMYTKLPDNFITGLEEY
jgi:3-oxoacyl-[acyl-carrier-protein] synthase-3